MEEEKLIKFVIRYLKGVLRENAIKSDDMGLRRLYVTYRRIQEDATRKSLIKEKKPVLQ